MKTNKKTSAKRTETKRLKGDFVFECLKELLLRINKDIRRLDENKATTTEINRLNERLDFVWTQFEKHCTQCACKN